MAAANDIAPIRVSRILLCYAFICHFLLFCGRNIRRPFKQTACSRGDAGSHSLQVFVIENMDPDPRSFGGAKSHRAWYAVIQIHGWGAGQGP